MNEPLNKTFWQNSPEELYLILGSSALGFTEKEAFNKLNGLNDRRKKPSGFYKDFLLLLSQFKSPLMILLIGAIVISALLGDTSDVFIILFIVISTGLLSFFQERNAGKVVEKLQSLIALKCNVFRNGISQEIDSSKIVPGDILLLKAGDILPADCLIIEANELHVNESGLTGESFPIRKSQGILPQDTELAARTNCLWEGSSVVSGNGKALVIFTGKDTIFGSLEQSISKNIETSFEKGIREFGFFLMKITIALSVFILIVNIVNHKSIVESALFALALAVGMAPELLPAITTIAMSAGAKRLLDKKVIVKKLSSIQNLGEVNLLCTDKTGTLTEGAICVKGLVNFKGEEDEFVKKIAFFNAIFESGYSNPIDEALKQIHFLQTPLATKIAEIPYDFIRKRISVLVKSEEGQILISKGAFNQILEICSKIKMSDGSIQDINPFINELKNNYQNYGNHGLRVIGISYKEVNGNMISKNDESEMIFAGFILLNDPVKPDILETIASLQNLGVELKIISGDNRNVAQSVSLQIGITNPNIMTGAEMLKTSTEALIQKVQEINVFAEVEPQQKERIILALKHSYTVAYMGDGINDVSAINAADVGISVENAVDVAREAADFVLMEKDLMVLVDGIKEGRKTFANTLKYIFINTGSTFGNMFSVAVASLILPFLPMLPKQILLTNFITDFPYLSVASDNVDQEQVNEPGKWNLKLIRNYMLIFGLHSSLFDVLTFMVLYFVLKVKENAFQTAWFVESILTELFILFIIRTQKQFYKSKPGKFLFILSVLGLILTIALPYLPFASEFGLAPLPMLNIGLMFSIVLLYVITADFLKVWFFRKFNNS